MSEEKYKLNIEDVNLKNEMESAYLDYSMSVIVSRAIPDVRDGLKPVHRRIIYGMQQQGLTPDKKYSKSARLVGEVMGKYHPHGDAAIYDAVVRLAQPFNMRYPLVDGQGNFGSIDGDGAAAPRYTELRMEKLALEMLRDINKDTVDFVDNYDGEEKEPVVLPSRFPNLLVNGSSGIAVGMATNMPTHNLREVTAAVIATMENPDITTDELMKYIKAPDFPTGGNIMGTAEVKRAYETGRGKLILRAEARIEEYKTNRFRIIVTEIPYQVNKSNLVKKIADLVRNKKIEGISDLRDESDRKGMRIVIELKRDANPNVVLNNLYKYTQMQTTFGIINLALVDGIPKVLSLKELINHYILHQENVVTRRTEFDLKKAQDRLHIVKGLLISIDNIDEIIEIIRNSYDNALENLMDRFDFTEIQAQSILDMRLKRLQGLEKEKLEDERAELEKNISYYKEILEDKKKLLGVIKEELSEISEKFGDDRRSKIVRDYSELEDEELFEEEDMVINITDKGYIKRCSVDSYRVQNRGGKGVSGMGMKDGDYVETMFTSTTHQELLFFTSLGKVYSLKAYEIPEASRTARGNNIINLLELEPEETVTQVLPIDKDSKDKYVVFVTKKGKAKKTELDLYRNVRRTGIKAIKIDDDDELIDVKLVSKGEDIILVTKKGQAIRFSEEELRPLSRNSIGVKGMTLNKNDELVSFCIATGNEYLAVISENGYGKKTKLSEYHPQSRAGKGVKTYKVTKKTGDLIGAIACNDEDEILMVSKNADVIRLSVNDISTYGRMTSGVLLKNTYKGEDSIVAVTKYIEEEIED
ncbi:MAG: DNA gyrase subunit A [Finegoldia sp.]|nr:DNA gyrase subunit A [Finegoldia sp.]